MCPADQCVRTLRMVSYCTGVSLVSMTSLCKGSHYGLLLYWCKSFKSYTHTYIHIADVDELSTVTYRDINMYMCVCVCVYIYVYIHIYIHIHTHTHTHTYMHTYMHAYIHTYSTCDSPQPTCSLER